MKRGKKASSDDPIITNEYEKSTYLLPPTLKQNLKYIGLKDKQEQSDLVRDILTDYVRSRGLDPAQEPPFFFPGKQEAPS